MEHTDASPSDPDRFDKSVIDIVAEVLGLPAEEVGPDRDFQEMGLDSILAVEFTVAVRKETGAQMQATSVYEFPTPRAYAQQLARISPPEQG